MSANIKHKSSGFSIVELNLSITIMAILLVSLLTVFVNFFVIMTRTNTIVDMTVDSQSLLRTVVEELRYGAGVRVSSTITDANAPPAGWDTSNTDFVIVIAVPAVDSNRSYIIDPNTGSPYLNELVYFKDGGTLYKRILANPSASGNSLLTSCPSSVASVACPADRKLVDNVNTMVFTLYDQDNAQTTDPLLARSIKIDLGLQKDTFGPPLIYDNSVRVTLRNVY